MKTIISAATLLLLLGMSAASAASYSEYPAPTFYPFQRSFVTGRLVVIPPYEQPFVERVYTTPPQQPYYNVPPYRVIAPY